MLKSPMKRDSSMKRDSPLCSTTSIGNLKMNKTYVKKTKHEYTYQIKYINHHVNTENISFNNLVIPCQFTQWVKSLIPTCFNKNDMYLKQGKC